MVVQRGFQTGPRMFDHPIDAAGAALWIGPHLHANAGVGELFGGLVVDGLDLEVVAGIKDDTTGEGDGDDVLCGEIDDTGESEREVVGPGIDDPLIDGGKGASENRGTDVEAFDKGIMSYTGGGKLEGYTDNFVAGPGGSDHDREGRAGLGGYGDRLEIIDGIVQGVVHDSSSRFGGQG